VSSASQSAHHNPSNNFGPAQPHTTDQTGQICPPGQKPKLTATLWEDEGTLCFQVESGGLCVARREGAYSFIFYRSSSVIHHSSSTLHHSLQDPPSFVTG